MKKIRGQIVYPLKERLLRLSKLNDKTGCIEWISSTYNGYGKLLIGSRTDKTRRTITAHRLSWEINHGKIPEKMLVCHKCDNRKCINVAHLFLGTFQDNIDDREKKGRNKLPLRLKGEDHPNSKLTWKKVNKIRSLHKIITQQQIANLFGVSRENVRDILLNRLWKLPTPPTK